MSRSQYRGILFAACAAAGLGMASSANAELVLHWGFDEESGPAIDTGATPANNGVLINGPTRSTDTPGGIGYSIDLRDDASTHAYVATDGDADQLDGLGDFTLSTWLKLDEYPGDGSGNARLIAKQAGSPNWEGISWNLASTGAGPEAVATRIFLGGSGGFAFNSPTPAFDATDWTFLAVTYDADSGETIFYTGGVDTQVSQLATATISAGVINDNAVPFAVGAIGPDDGVDYSVAGWQDDVRVYDEVLGSAGLDAVRLAAIPEPTSMGLLLGAGGLMLARRRR